jgi:PIN domain nuclease of toxin-antitoxin system
MRLLLDTHALLWWLTDDPKLSKMARTCIMDSDTTVYVSSASSWEIAIKYRLGKLPEVFDLIEHFSAYLRKERFEALVITTEDSLKAGLLPAPHRDPFDRMLIAQALIRDLHVVTLDSVFTAYGVKVVW